MGQETKAITDGVTATLFVLSFHQRSEMAQVVAGAGWNAVVIDDADELETRFVESGAIVAVIDARGALDAGLAATQVLGVRIAMQGGALLILVSRGDVEAIGEFYAAGATQFLASPAGESELVQALRFAARHAERIAGAPDVERRGGLGSWPQDRDAGDARHWIAARIAQDRPVGLVMVALSRLDIVNAAHGRPGVDALIEAAGRRIGGIAHALFGDQALVARIGGAEFVLVAEAWGVTFAAAAAQMGQALARPFAIPDAVAVLGSRFGIAEREPGDDAAALLRRASEALADAKSSDGAVMRTAMPDGVAPMDALAVDLHHAIDRGEIDVLFQPQVEIASGRIIGVEALARWDHATLGALGAETLFAAADRADLGIALSDHIQRLVLARAAMWPKSLNAIRVSLNLTAADVTRPGFAALFLARIDESGFPRGRLTVELTETGLIQDLAAASSLLAELRGAGCRVAIDDFGTGYSSLAYLKALPLDYLKIDKALVHDIAGSPRDRIVVAGTIAMARSLGLSVIAEGVETVEQLDLLAAEGCSLYQGFLRAEPLDEVALAAMVAAE